jgi:regulator of sigma D
MKAVDSNDAWHVLAIAQDQPAFRLAYGRLTGAQKKACKEQEQRAASARFDYCNNLADYAGTGDALGAQQLLAELGGNARAKQMVWDQLDANTKAFIKKLKEAA